MMSALLAALLLWTSAHVAISVRADGLEALQAIDHKTAGMMDRSSHVYIKTRALEHEVGVENASAAPSDGERMAVKLTTSLIIIFFLGVCGYFLLSGILRKRCGHRVAGLLFATACMDTMTITVAIPTSYGFAKHLGLGAGAWLSVKGLTLNYHYGYTYIEELIWFAPIY